MVNLLVSPQIETVTTFLDLEKLIKERFVLDAEELKKNYIQCTEQIEGEIIENEGTCTEKCQ